MTFNPVFTLSTLLASIIGLLWLNGKRRRQPLPPGPRGIPWVGSPQLMDRDSNEHRWITFKKLARIYGDVFHFVVFGHHTVVLSSYDSIMELFEKRSYNYADRPDLPMFNDLLGGSWLITGMRHTEEWRLHRRVFHQSFQPRTVPQYYDVQRKATLALMSRLLTPPEPNELVDHLKHHAGEMILNITYGYDLKTKDDPYLKLIYASGGPLGSTASFGTWWVDFVPMMKSIPSWFPGATFQIRAKEWAPHVEALRDVPWRWMKTAIENGTSVPCVSSAALERFTGRIDDSTLDEVVKNCTGIAYIGATETTMSNVMSFILAMVLHPEFQRRAQQEIDTVIGTGRLPDFDDKDDLPYIGTLLLETLRWRPVFPLAVAHRASNDDFYHDYLIPAGSTVIANTRAILHDETLYGKNASDFDPSRFDQREGGQTPPNPEQFAFGYGRRICPGRYFALNSLYLTMSYLLATFTMAKALDDKGNEIEPEMGCTEIGILSIPKPFKCRFIPRNPGLVARMC